MAARKKPSDKKQTLKNYYQVQELAVVWSDDPKNKSEVSQVLANSCGNFPGRKFLLGYTARSKNMSLCEAHSLPLICHTG